MLLGPLAPTAVLVAAEVLLWPRPLALGALAAMVAAWLALAVWALRRAEAFAQRGKVTAEQQGLMAELGDLARGELLGVQGEVDRSRQLIREAVAQLNGSFRSMEEQSRRQRAMITGLVDEDGAGSPGVRGFAEAAGALTSDLARMLADDSRESVRTVQLIGEMTRNLDDTFVLLADLQGIAEQAARMASQAARPGIPDPRSALMAFAFDMRQLTTQSSNLNERIDALIRSSKAIVNRVRARVEETAEREMNASIEAQARSVDLIGQVTAINRSLASGINLVSQCGSRIQQDVANAVRSLQFEDITSQAMTAASTHLDRLRAINRDAAGLQQLLVSATGPAGVQTPTMEEFGRQLRKKRNAWRQPAHKPVSQVTMRPGSVELF